MRARAARVHPQCDQTAPGTDRPRRSAHTHGRIATGWQHQRKYAKKFKPRCSRFVPWTSSAHVAAHVLWCCSAIPTRHCSTPSDSMRVEAGLTMVMVARGTRTKHGRMGGYGAGRPCYGAMERRVGQGKARVRDRSGSMRGGAERAAVVADRPSVYSPLSLAMCRST